MNIFTKELYVVAYGQSVKFRLVKYSILVPLFAAGYWWLGRDVFISTLGVVFGGAIIVHLLFRWKTDGWMKKWGLYTPPDVIVDLKRKAPPE